MESEGEGGVMDCECFREAVNTLAMAILAAAFIVGCMS